MKRDDEFREIIFFIKDMWFTMRSFEHLRCMWTTYCIHHDILIDTADYDNDMMCMFNLVRAISRQTKQKMDTNKLKRLYFKNFDNFMGKYMA